MTCRLAVALICFLVLAGCGDQHRPAVRGTASELDPEHGSRPPGPDSFHSEVAAGPGAEALGPEVDLGEVRFQAPSGWVRKQPQSGIIVAEFSLPRVAPDTADGRLTVAVAGGTIQQNVDLWRQQFSGKPEKESQEKLTVAGVPVTLVDFSGTYTDQRGMGGPAEKGKGYRMLGAILDVRGRLHFIKCYGPQKTIAAHSEEFRGFVQSLQLKQPAK